MARKTNPYLYIHEAKGKTRYGYRREYKGKQLRARGFGTSLEAEQHLSQAIADVDARQQPGIGQQVRIVAVRDR